MTHLIPFSFPFLFLSSIQYALSTHPLNPLILVLFFQYLKQLARDALWSDPRVEDGYDVNHRGAGVLFGPDRTRAFLKTNKLKMIVRLVIYFRPLPSLVFLFSLSIPHPSRTHSLSSSLFTLSPLPFSPHPSLPSHSLSFSLLLLPSLSLSSLPLSDLMNVFVLVSLAPMSKRMKTSYAPSSPPPTTATVATLVPTSSSPMIPNCYYLPVEIHRKQKCKPCLIPTYTIPYCTMTSVRV